MGEPGAAARACPHGVGYARNDQDAFRQSPLFDEEAPGRRAARQRPAAVPTLGNGNLRSPGAPRANGLGKRRGDADEIAQQAAGAAETQAGVEVADEAEDIAFALAQRIPPAVAVVVDDQDFARAAAVFEASAGAFRAVELPHRGQPLEQRGTAHAGLQLLNNLLVLFAHRSALLSGSAGQGNDAASSSSVLPYHLTPRQPRRRCGARACAARERIARRTLAAHPA
jgi:hypothetical protein